ncbi:glycosyltransferase [uncultured Shewanella sp.]|uniref:glycosyltransferase n=1 Tax=uncultured Shewanella sp. TaxID=173975 RepID=UPI00261339E2|nr:glycosyltransferase [uncultured Shewanella sp.]
MKPLVSIIICTHNRSLLLTRAIESVINQSYSNIEIIVSDDASTDNTADIVKQFIINNPKISIFYRCNDTNMGACFTRNQGIKLACGKFITGLDDDDSFDVDRISKFVDYYDDKYSFFCSDIKVVGKNKSYNLFNGKNKVITLCNALWYNCIGNQIFVERDRLMKVNGFDVNLTSAQDIDLWVRLIENYGVCYRLSENTYNLFIDHDSPRITTSNNKLKGLINYFEKHSSKMTVSQRRFHLLRYEYWKNNKKFKLSFIKYLDLNILFLFLKIVFSKGIN